MSTLELCEKYFETRDIYKLMGIEKDANEKIIKKAYHRLSLLVHPDRVSETQKAESTEKFKVLSKIYQVLTDTQKRALYNEQGIIDDDDDCKLTSLLELWSKIFKPLTVEEISNYEKEYVGSEMERADIKKAYLGGKGCINYIMNHVPFMKVEDELRFQEIVSSMIASNEIPEYKIFTEEPASKRNKRHKKYARESREAKIIKERNDRRQQKDAESSDGSNFEDRMLIRRDQRESAFNSFMGRLLEKYGEEEAVSKKKKPKAKTAAKKGKPSDKIKTIKNGRVEKAKH